MSIRSSRLALGAVLALYAAPAAAQVAPVNPFSFGVSAGAAIPTGDGSDGVNTGFSVDGIIALRAPASPLSFRGEVGFTRFGIKDVDNVNFRVLSGVANAVYSFSAGPTSVVRPYLIGGVGLYNIDVTGDDVDDDDFEGETKAGFNGGIGIELPLSGITGFGEIRYTTVLTENERTSWIPIRFGIRF